MYENIFERKKNTNRNDDDDDDEIALFTLINWNAANENRKFLKFRTEIPSHKNYMHSTTKSFEESTAQKKTWK